MFWKAQPSRVVLAHLQKRGAGKTYYWKARGNRPVPIGFQVPPSIKSLSSLRDPVSRKLEALFEEIRANEFPNRPSRIGSVFVCPDDNLAFGWCDPRKGTVYEVQVTGKVFETNLELYTEASERARFREWVGVPEIIREYWGGKYPQVPEVLVGGKVVVIRAVDPSEVGDPWEDLI